MLVAGVVALIGAGMGPFIRRGSNDGGREHPFVVVEPRVAPCSVSVHLLQKSVG